MKDLAIELLLNEKINYSKTICYSRPRDFNRYGQRLLLKTSVDVIGVELYSRIQIHFLNFLSPLYGLMKNLTCKFSPKIMSVIPFIQTVT